MMAAHGHHATDTARAVLVGTVSAVATTIGAINPDEIGGVIVGAAGALSLIGLAVKLLADRRNEDALRDGYIKLVGELQDERNRLRAVVDDLRGEIRALHREQRALLERLNRETDNER